MKGAGMSQSLGKLPHPPQSREKKRHPPEVRTKRKDRESSLLTINWRKQLAETRFVGESYGTLFFDENNEAR
jgi:hypothetical protein